MPDHLDFLRTYLEAMDRGSLIEYAIEQTHKLSRDRRLDGVEGMAVYDSSFLGRKLLEKADSYLRHGYGFTVIGGDVAGLHYTNEVEDPSWGYGNEKLQIGAKAFYRRLRKGEILAVLGIDEYFIVLENNPDSGKIIAKIEEECADWSSKQDKSPLMFGFGHITESSVDDYVRAIIGKDRPETRDEWSAVAASGKSSYFSYVKEIILGQIRNDKETRVYSMYPDFERLRMK